MAKLNISPTKSSLLTLRRQLAFAQEGFDLLEQKRQILIVELMGRLARAREAERRVDEALRAAFAALQETTLDIGSVALERAADCVRLEHLVEITHQHLMGLRLPHVLAQIEPVSIQFGVSETSANTDTAMRKFVELLPLLAQLAELQNAVRRLARELRKTQRRCNSLSKIFIPAYAETIAYITATLEERERESFVIFKMIRDRIARGEEPSCAK